MNARIAASLLAAAIATSGCTVSQGITRGYFGLHDHDNVVHITSNSDYLVCIWARNVETFRGGVQITTPASQFRGPGSTGPVDGLVLDVPPQTGLDLGCLGGRANERINISDAFGARVTVFVTVQSKEGSLVSMIRE